MRLASYNVEWFTNLFADDGALLEDGALSGRQGVTRADQIAALGHVFAAMDADAVMVIEAPDTNRRRSTSAALHEFADRFGLRTRQAVTGFTNDTQQEIAWLYDPDRMTARHDPQGGAVPRFDGEFHIDLDIDAARDAVTFSKPPLELAVETARGARIRVIGAHLKSKAPHGAQGRDAVMRLSIANRRKQLAQAIWLRARIDAHLTAGEPVIVLGDLNDGPGLDEYENLFGRSSVEIVLGEGAAALYDPHARAALARRIGPAPTTSRFFLADQRRYLSALLDYVMISPDLRDLNPRWRILHPFDDPECWRDAGLQRALLTASDHFPVVLDIDI
jgi:endonuclease/exonuclease/phosphatase family metal-dependent hydrolase